MTTAEPVDIGSGATAHARHIARQLLIFGANRVVGVLPGHKLRLAYFRHALGWAIGQRSSLHYGLTVFGGRGRVRIGDMTTLQTGCLIVGAGMTDLTIGNRVAIAYRVSLIMATHDIRSPAFETRLAPISIEDYVFIGSNATVLMGVTLGEGTVVGAGAVVTRSTAPYSIVQGVPARVVGERPRGLSYSPEHFWPFH